MKMLRSLLSSLLLVSSFNVCSEKVEVKESEKIVKVDKIYLDEKDLLGKCFFKIAIFPKHEAAYYYWKFSEYTELIRKNNILVLVDEHSDDGCGYIKHDPNRYIGTNDKLEDKLHSIYWYIQQELVPVENEGYAFCPINSATYIWPAVEYDGLIKEVYWIAPAIDTEYARYLEKSPFVEFGSSGIPFNVRKLNDLESLIEKNNGNLLLTIDLDYFYVRLRKTDARKKFIDSEVPKILIDLKNKIGEPSGIITIAETRGLSPLTREEQGHLNYKVVSCLDSLYFSSTILSH